MERFERLMIETILLPQHVNLSLRATNKAEGVAELLAPLRGDGRVTDPEALEKAVVERDAPTLCEGPVGICIAHGRTSAVRSLVFAAGRSPAGIVCPDSDVPIKLLFVAGIPSAMHSQYLRIVGATVRACRCEGGVNALLSASSADEFIEVLSDAMGSL